MDEAVLRREYPPGGEDEYGDAYYYRYEDGCHPVHEILHRGLAALGVLHHADNLREHGIAAGLVSPEAEGAFLVDGTGVDLGLRLLQHRHRLTAEHALVHVGLAAEHRSVHCHPFAGPDYDGVAGAGPLYGHLLPAAVLREHCHRLGLKSHEAADGSGSLLLGAGLQQAADEDEGYDDTGRFEVQMRFDAAGEPELRKEQIERTEQPGHSGTAGHEGIHVDGPVPQLPDRVYEEAVAEDEYHHCGQDESHPLSPAQVHEEHTEDKDGQGSYDSTCGLTPESAVLPETLRLRCLLLILHVRYQTVTCLLDGLSQSLGRAFAVIITH